MNQKPNPSSFICAALPSVRVHCDGVLKDYPDHVNPDNIKNFFAGNVNKFLSSYGLGLNREKKVNSNVTERYERLHFNKFTDSPYLKNVEKTIDSGGYQVQTGYIKKHETSELIKLYYDFVEKRQDDFDYAFVLDLAPGATSCIYDSWQELYKYNTESLVRAAQLSAPAREKIEYIHHFRTPKINETWKKMLFEDGLADPFQNFGTGGLVSFANSAQMFPVVMYIVPLIHILTYAKKRGLKKFRFHVLGGSEYKDIVFHKFAEHHIKKVHDIDVEITYDSSSIFKILAMSRFTYVSYFDQKQLWKLTVREQELQRMFRGEGTHEEVFVDFLNKAVTPYGMKPINLQDNPLYKDGVMSRITYLYGFFQLLKIFGDVDNFSKHVVKELYPYYEQGHIQKFDDEIEKIMIGFNNGKISKRIHSRISSILNSLDALTNLDMDYCDYLVNRYFSNDECSQLMEDKVCTW